MTKNHIFFIKNKLFLKDNDFYKSYIFQDVKKDIIFFYCKKVRLEKIIHQTKL